MNFAGSCLCGTVKFEIDATPQRFYFCHCQQCRKLTGSAHASNILLEPAPIRWIQGGDSVHRYDAPEGREFTHVFCRHCGSGLPFLNVSGKTLFIPAGTIDSALELEVTRNIFWNEAPAWQKSGLKAPRCKKFPD